MAVMAIIRGLGLLFYILLGFMYVLLLVPFLISSTDIVIVVKMMASSIILAIAIGITILVITALFS